MTQAALALTGISLLVASCDSPTPCERFLDSSPVEDACRGNNDCYYASDNPVVFQFLFQLKKSFSPDDAQQIATCIGEDRGPIVTARGNTLVATGVVADIDDLLVRSAVESVSLSCESPSACLHCSSGAASLCQVRPLCLRVDGLEFKETAGENSCFEFREREAIACVPNRPGCVPGRQYYRNPENGGCLEAHTVCPDGVPGWTVDPTCRPGETKPFCSPR